MLIMSETKRQKIDRLRALLESGVSSDSTDGASTTFDLDSARRELARLEREVGRLKRRSRAFTRDMTRR
jgi:hypothetical protein